MPLVLVVDDHADICYLAVRALKQCGLNAHGVLSGEAALSYMHDVVPSVVVLDFMMPGMDGLEVLRQMRSDPALSSVPVVMNTAFCEGAVQAEAKQLGAMACIQKGELDKLVEVVRQLH